MGVLFTPVCFKYPHLNVFHCGARQRALALANSFVCQSSIFGSRNSKKCGLIQACKANFNEFSNEELAQNFNDSNAALEISENSTQKECGNCINMGFSVPFSPSILEALEPSFLGIHPEPPPWPERDEIINMNIQRKANCVDIPLSLRMIKKKQKGQKEFTETGDSAACSVKKAFSSMVFIIRELQNHALDIRESLYCEDLHEIMGNFKKEMGTSFVWLFQQVFSKTPNLMVYVMILLANFTLHSMINNNASIAAVPSPRMSMSREAVIETVLETEENNQEQIEHSKNKKKYLRFSLPNQHPNPNVAPDETSEVRNDWFEDEEELSLWNAIVEEALKMKDELIGDVVDYESLKKMVSPVSVEIEAYNYEDYYRTDLLYQMSLSQEPDNPLLLSNYAQFLYLVARDYDRAEECFKRAMLFEPPDAETASRFADFLWRVRNDLWGAEERYLEALAANPGNPYHASKYANFLWSTGGEDTCYPLKHSP